MMFDSHRVPELDDPFGMTIKDMRKILDKLAKKHGVKSTIHFSAGYNNIDCVIRKPKKKRKA